MKKSTKEVFDMFLGKTPAKKFKRIMILLITFFIGFMLIQNLGWSWTKEKGFSIQWQPAAEIKVNKNL